MSEIKRPRFTEEEIEIILNAVKKNSKKTVAFREAHEKMGKTHSVYTISSKYYRDLVNRKPKRKTYTRKSKRKPKSFWSKILNSLFNFR